LFYFIFFYTFTSHPHIRLAHVVLLLNMLLHTQTIKYTELSATTTTTSNSQASAAVGTDPLSSTNKQTNVLTNINQPPSTNSTNEGMLEAGRVVTVRSLLKGLYEKACQQKLWGLVRHTAGMLGKRVEDLAKAVTDLLVRQKQVTVGMPPNNEFTVTAPLPETDLRQLIHEAYGDDESTAMLTQELLVYLAMFIRTEPQLFLEMLRLRVGLIIQVGRVREVRLCSRFKCCLLFSRSWRKSSLAPSTAMASKLPSIC